MKRFAGQRGRPGFQASRLATWVAIALFWTLPAPSAERRADESGGTSGTPPPQRILPSEEPTNDLTVGKSHSENLQFKASPEYEIQQSAEAVRKLDQIKDLRGGTNEWEEVARLLKEVLASDASRKVKLGVKQLALLELAGISEKSGQLEQALQFLAEYIERYPTDPIVPEVLLWQGYILRRMGAYDLAISKFYLVITTSLRLPTEDLTYYQRVALTAKSEIADAHYDKGDHKEAADLYAVLLNDTSDELNRVVIKVKLARALARAKEHEQVITRAAQFLEDHSGSEYQAEIRYLLASAYKALDRKEEALRELLLLLEAVEVAPEPVMQKWKSWKMMAGNEIGNQLFLEGDYLNAVQVYKGLVRLDSTARWQLPILYQIGLCFERLSQPNEALDAYRQIAALGEKNDFRREEHLQMVVDMARFRAEVLSWKQSLEQEARSAETRVAGRTN